uniref:Uncharacterized protein n=1 Tax=Anopheles funestus TaxID=62324 RepID=A0A182RTW0_ANOFN
ISLFAAPVGATDDIRQNRRIPPQYLRPTTKYLESSPSHRNARTTGQIAPRQSQSHITAGSARLTPANLTAHGEHDGPVYGARDRTNNEPSQPGFNGNLHNWNPTNHNITRGGPPVTYTGDRIHRTQLHDVNDALMTSDASAYAQRDPNVNNPIQTNACSGFPCPKNICLSPRPGDVPLTDGTTVTVRLVSEQLNPSPTTFLTQATSAPP